MFASETEFVIVIFIYISFQKCDNTISWFQRAGKNEIS